jgi:small-conductance mechanosensitive channel/CRP-like cAMP-binding protein
VWESIHKFAWYEELPLLVGVLAVLAAMVLRFRPQDRRSVTGTLILFVVGVVGLFVCGFIYHVLHMQRLGDTLHEISLIIEGIAVIRLASLFIFHVLLGRFSVPIILEDIMVGIAYFAWGLVRLRYAGMDLSGLVTTSAVVTAVIAFSLQDTLGNLLGGLALELDDSFDLGDWISVDNVSGRVLEIRWRSTSIVTPNGETVVFPNSVLMKTRFSVVGRRQNQAPQGRRWIWFHVDYGAAPPRVISAVQDALAAATIPNVSAEPKPSCLLMDFDRSSARYALRYWLTNLELGDTTDSQVRTHIFAALQREGMRLSVPEYNVNLTKAGQKRAAQKRTREAAQRLELLRRVDILQPLNDGELATIAEQLRFTPFAAGETVMRQGSTGDWLYILASGVVEVYQEGAQQGRQLLGTLQGCTTFGELGLMTGLPRAATFVAKSDIECYQLEKSLLDGLLHRRPELAHEISHILATRSHLAFTPAEGSGPATQIRNSQPASELLTRIQRFFGL